MMSSRDFLVNKTFGQYWKRSHMAEKSDSSR
jgi:hypothetical protein